MYTTKPLYGYTESSIRALQQSGQVLTLQATTSEGYNLLSVIRAKGLDLTEVAEVHRDGSAQVVGMLMKEGPGVRVVPQSNTHYEVIVDGRPVLAVSHDPQHPLGVVSIIEQRASRRGLGLEYEEQTFSQPGAVYNTTIYNENQGYRQPMYAGVPVAVNPYAPFETPFGDPLLEPTFGYGQPFVETQIDLGLTGLQVEQDIPIGDGYVEKVRTDMFGDRQVEVESPLQQFVEDLTGLNL